MKKTFKYIMLAAVGIVGMLQLSSCQKDNDWSVDSSVTKQYPATSLEISVDSAALSITTTIGHPSNAPTLILQVSTSPLTSNEDIPVTDPIYEFKYTTPEGTNTATRTIPQSGADKYGNDNGFVVKGNTTYYFRVRCKGTDGTLSNWYTNGMLYYGGIPDETVAERMTQNTYSNITGNGDNDKKNSFITTPTRLSVPASGVGEDELVINYYYSGTLAQPTKVVYTKEGETEGESEEIADEYYAKGGTSDNPIYYCNHTISGLDPGQTYNITLYKDEEVVGTCSCATEEAPVKDYAFFIGNFPNKSASDADFTLKATDADGNESDLVTCKFIIASKMKSGSSNYKAAKDCPFTSPFDKTATFWPLAPTATETPAADVKAYRLQTGGSTSKLVLNVPAKGRLYFYAATAANLTITQNGVKTVVPITTTGTSSSAPGGYTKAYVEAGEVTINWSKSIYLYGIHYVPWSKVEEE